MKQWRVYQIFADGRQRCASRSYDRKKCEVMAFMLFCMDAPGVVAIEMRSPDGRIWRKEKGAEPTPEQAQAARERLLALSPEELAERKKEAGTRLYAFFSSPEPPVPESVKRVMDRFHALLAERNTGSR